MYRFIMMACGYVESAMTSTLIYQCGFFGCKGYKTRKEAITELALDLYAKYYDDRLSVYQQRYSDEVKECCRKALCADKSANFCSSCGSAIKDKEFDYEDFMEYVTGLHCTTADSYGDAEYAGGRSFCWWPYWIKDFVGAKKSEVIVIAEQAESVLLAALLEAKPELKNENGELVFGGSDDWDRFRNEEQPEYC